MIFHKKTTKKIVKASVKCPYIFLVVDISRKPDFYFFRHFYSLLYNVLDPRLGLWVGI